jgi:hypothetical protein
MKLKMAVLVMTVGGVVGLAVLWSGSSATANDGATIAAGTVTTLAMADKEFEYTGSKKCKMCHSKELKAWEETKHAKAFNTLKAGEAKEVKEKFKLDPAKDYTTDKTCLACHTVGFGKKSGYAVPDAADEKAVKAAEDLQGVGCEACHGPGSEYNVFKKDIKKEKRKYKFAQLAELGMTKVEAGVCTTCHNDKGPTFDKAKPFDFAKMSKDDKAIHTHEKLELRED